MNIVSTDPSQVIKITPYGDISYFHIIDETANQSFPITDFSTENKGYYIEVTLNLELVENRFYTLRSFNESDELINEDRLFCTNQNTAEFSINSGVFTQRTTENTYLTYE